MPVGGEPARQRTVLTLSRGGKVVAAVVLGGAGAAGAGLCCAPQTPPAEPPMPAPTVTAPLPQTDAAGQPDALLDVPVQPSPGCVYSTPRSTRTMVRRTPRIVGGTTAEEGAYPFAAAIATPARRQYCGGTVVGERFVCTAAHCMVQPGDLVLVGAANLNNARGVRVVESRLHPQYDPLTHDYDVAVAVLEQPAGVETIPLAEGITTNNAWVIGWGRLYEGGPQSPALQQVPVPLWDDDDCADVYAGLTERQVCAAPKGGMMDSCQGDSGGPLLTWNVDHWEQLGVVSFGRGCARPNAPGVYTDMREEEIRSWVQACSSAAR